MLRSSVFSNLFRALLTANYDHVMFVLLHGLGFGQSRESWQLVYDRSRLGGRLRFDPLHGRLIASAALTASSGCLERLKRLERRQPHEKHQITRAAAVCPPRTVSRFPRVVDADKPGVLTRFVRSDGQHQHSNSISQTCSTYLTHQTPNDAPAAGVSTKQTNSTASAAPIMVQSASDISYQQQEATAGPSSGPALAPSTNARLDTSSQPHTQPPMRKFAKVATGPRNNTHNHNGDPMEPAQRAAYITRFTYADMRDMSLHNPGPLLPKIPSPHETAVIFYAPDAPGADYTLVRKATHNFLDFDATFTLYATYCLLPAVMKPNKDDWDDTRDADQDDARKVRCLFCRARFGGRNAKAMWERHAREHWDKGGKQL